MTGSKETWEDTGRNFGAGRSVGLQILPAQAMIMEQKRAGGKPGDGI
jgi:hypothetical protein